VLQYFLALPSSFGKCHVLATGTAIFGNSSLRETTTMPSRTLVTLLAALFVGFASCSKSEIPPEKTVEDEAPAARRDPAVKPAPAVSAEAEEPIIKNPFAIEKTPAEPLGKDGKSEEQMREEAIAAGTIPKETYKIIRFAPETTRYFPNSLEMKWARRKENYVDHTKVDIAADRSRIGGPIVDLPKGIAYPAEMFFVAQLNLREFAEHDPLGLLPKTGFLYFFIGGYGDEGAVFNADVKADELVRVVKEHDKWFFDGCLVSTIRPEEENFAARYDREVSDEGGEATLEWNYGAGMDKSKIYGIYTHCQKQEETIIKITKSEYTLLLQIGSDVTGSGVWSVRIKTSDLEKRDFSKCLFEYGQS
jgi:uncharacterized protein YwqG